MHDVAVTVHWCDGSAGRVAVLCASTHAQIRSCSGGAGHGIVYIMPASAPAAVVPALSVPGTNHLKDVGQAQQLLCQNKA